MLVDEAQQQPLDPDGDAPSAEGYVLFVSSTLTEWGRAHPSLHTEALHHQKHQACCSQCPAQKLARDFYHLIRH